MCKKSFAKRREILNKIPEGAYCYEFLHGRTKGTRDHFAVILNICPYWKAIAFNDAGEVAKAKCTLYNIKDTNKNDLLLWDQVKICVENEYD